VRTIGAPMRQYWQRVPAAVHAVSSIGGSAGHPASVDGSRHRRRWSAKSTPASLGWGGFLHAASMRRPGACCCSAASAFLTAAMCRDVVVLGTEQHNHADLGRAFRHIFLA
jgi:hypothetical protein